MYSKNRVMGGRVITGGGWGGVVHCKLNSRVDVVEFFQEIIEVFYGARINCKNVLQKTFET